MRTRRKGHTMTFPSKKYGYEHVLGEGPNVSHRKSDGLGAARGVLMAFALLFSIIFAGWATYLIIHAILTLRTIY
jgi:hypothetical protein